MLVHSKVLESLFINVYEKLNFDQRFLPKTRIFPTSQGKMVSNVFHLRKEFYKCRLFARKNVLNAKEALYELENTFLRKNIHQNHISYSKIFSKPLK